MLAIGGRSDNIRVRFSVEPGTACAGARVNRKWAAMKSDIHPQYGKLVATCSCGNVIETGSTHSGEIHIEVCSQCHPFYTGKQKVLDTGGRIDRFNKRFGNRARVG